VDLRVSLVFRLGGVCAQMTDHWLKSRTFASAPWMRRRVCYAPVLQSHSTPGAGRVPELEPPPSLDSVSELLQSARKGTRGAGDGYGVAWVEKLARVVPVSGRLGQVLVSFGMSLTLRSDLVVESGSEHFHEGMPFQGNLCLGTAPFDSVDQYIGNLGGHYTNKVGILLSRC